ADLLDQRRQRAEGGFDVRGEADRKPVPVDPHLQREGIEFHRPQGDVDRELNFEDTAAGEVNPLIGRPAEAEAEVGFAGPPSEDLAEEAVAPALAVRHLPATDLPFEPEVPPGLAGTRVPAESADQVEPDPLRC